MSKLGVIAGGGTLPVELAKSAKDRGEKVVVFALEGMASPELEKIADRVYWMEIGQYRKFAFLLLKERIRKLVLAGKVDKNVIYKENNADGSYKKHFNKLKDKKDYSILEEITRHLKRVGVEVVDGMKYLKHLLPEAGVIGEVQPDERIEKDINFGYSVAKRLADLDIGQTVVVKNEAIVAVEAMEGTDATIERSREIAGEGCVMVKVSRTKQDMRWDVPTVGPDTIQKLSDNSFSAMAIESGKMYLIDKEEFIRSANSCNIVVKAL